MLEVGYETVTILPPFIWPLASLPLIRCWHTVYFCKMQEIHWLYVHIHISITRDKTALDIFPFKRWCKNPLISYHSLAAGLYMIRGVVVRQVFLDNMNQPVSIFPPAYTGKSIFCGRKSSRLCGTEGHNSLWATGNTIHNHMQPTFFYLRHFYRLPSGKQSLYLNIANLKLALTIRIMETLFAGKGTVHNSANTLKIPCKYIGVYMLLIKA